jgi:hypothetical protein
MLQMFLWYPFCISFRGLLFKSSGKLQTLRDGWSFQSKSLLKQSFGAATEFVKVFICTSSRNKMIYWKHQIPEFWDY